MKRAAPSEMLLSRLQLTVPDARTFMVATVRSKARIRDFGNDLAGAFERASYEVRRIDLDEDGRSADATGTGRTERAAPAGPGTRWAASARLSDLASVRAALAGFQGVTVVSGSGLLDNPNALLYAVAVDAVVVVAARGKTIRDDLQRAHIEIERFGGRLAGAVFMV